MHFEVLVEDQSGKKALDILIRKIIGDQHTFRVIEYRGIGHIPKNLKSSTVCLTNLSSCSGDMERHLLATRRTI